MRSLTYAAIMFLFAVILTGCNATDTTSHKSVATGPETIYADGARRVTTDELDAMLKDGTAIVVDVRNQAAYDLGHIRGARLIPANEIVNHINELPRDKMIVTYCA
jgi:predicted sulfurtransferase